MIKPILLISILLIPLVSAIYGGESEIVYHFDKCSSLDIIVSGTLEINKTEYNFSSCSETNENIWECDCYDGFDLIMTTKGNTLNNYTIEMTYAYQGEEVVIVSSNNGRTTSNSLICDDWSECIDGNMTRFCYNKNDKEVKYKRTRPCDMEIKINKPVIKEPETNETIILDPNINKTIIIEPKVKEEKSYKWLIIISSIIVTTVIIGVIINRRYKYE